MNLANKLTLIRIAVIPIFIACFYIKTEYSETIAAILFLAAYLTDILDGYYARKYKMVTNFGKFMDPIADKLLSTSALIMLVHIGKLNPIIALIIIGREFIISGFRLIAVESGTVIAASPLAKLKTVSQCVAISLLLFNNPIFSLINIPMDMIMVYISLVLTIWSGIEYIYKNRSMLKFE